MTTSLSPVRVLIIDDIAHMRQELQVLLELTGAVQVVGEAGDDQEVVDLAERLRPDVVVMDL